MVMQLWAFLMRNIFWEQSSNRAEMVRFVRKVQCPHPHELGAVAVGAQTISYPSPPSSLLLPHPPWRGQHHHPWGPVPTFEIWGHGVVQVSPGNRPGALRQSLAFWRALSTCVLRAKRLVPAEAAF